VTCSSLGQLVEYLRLIDGCAALAPGFLGDLLQGRLDELNDTEYRREMIIAKLEFISVNSASPSLIAQVYVYHCAMTSFLPFLRRFERYGR
jgi:hypothetical protein